MNNKTIIEFGFRIIFRIMENSEGVRITPPSISKILHKILSLIYSKEEVGAVNFERVSYLIT